ncbi:ComEA family DNA-binding protein [Cryobacterium frigoriphilum]|uniref:ComEA family DNA-binding protein n=1 Tax=Cryobacterium frigoriphilum TaxID=1259150 RepID=A0A4R9A4W9_9MICO|nr:ComEA family DNA-binding protein [Cryobacterium frigoriphilum]TFD51588.1 ComEA family DNA-binding protein [Cryobacterium frigoriphilum]
MPVPAAPSPDDADDVPDDSGALQLLVPAARLPERPPQRVHLRVGVGAAIVLLLAALVITVVVSAVGQQSGSRVVAADAAGSGAVPLGDDEPGAAAASDAPADSGGTASAAGAIIFVHVLGAVERPGLFELPDGARVIDAVAAAGGLTDTADPAGANLARLLSDGEQLYLPRVGEVPAGVPPGVSAGADAGAGGSAATIVNLNTATVADLDTLPRIGPAMAQRILDYREANGPFTSTDDLRNVTGIGDKTFEALKDLVTV